MKKQLPDIAETKSSLSTHLNWVGMSRIALPLTIKTSETSLPISANIDAFVDLNPQFKGIHMSRIYQNCIDQVHKPLTPFSLQDWVSQIRNTHTGLSEAAKVKVQFNYLMNRPSLITDNHGWNRYPCIASCTQTKNTITQELVIKLLYSSTCPCSTSLSKQMLIDQMLKQFPNEQIQSKDLETWLSSHQIPTPHSQRSEATIAIKIPLSAETFPIDPLIQDIEKTLGTPVQTMVKRRDEQEFAKLNGENLMFCEDAARKLKISLDSNPNYLDFHVHVRHIESLHGHDAVSVAVKGLPQGYIPLSMPADLFI